MPVLQTAEIPHSPLPDSENYSQPQHAPPTPTSVTPIDVREYFEEARSADSTVQLPVPQIKQLQPQSQLQNQQKPPLRRPTSASFDRPKKIASAVAIPVVEMKMNVQPLASNLPPKLAAEHDRDVLQRLKTMTARNYYKLQSTPDEPMTSTF